MVQRSKGVLPPPAPPAPPRQPRQAASAAPTPAAVDIPTDLLRAAAHTIAQRGQQRDTSESGAAQERSMAACVAAFNALEGTQLSERQGWAFMQTLKLARAAASARNGTVNPDDYLDGAAYAALGYECVARGAQQP